MPEKNIRLSRRAFLRNGTLVLAATSTWQRYARAAVPADPTKIGLLTDLHYADKSPAGTRFYRETLSKLEEAASEFEAADLDFVVELGDLIDAADSVEVEKKYLKTIDREFSAICKRRHYVLGNHCVDTLHKEEFLGQVGQQKSYYSFDHGGVHVVILDACFTSTGEPYGRKNFTWTDSNIPASELEWLKADLAETENPVIVFAHQRLDVSNHHGVKNNAAVRSLLEASGKVLAVFQGHSHQNDLKEIGDIHYCTLAAMVEGSGATNNAYSRLDVDSTGTIQLVGFRRQTTHDWPRA